MRLLRTAFIWGFLLLAPLVCLIGYGIVEPRSVAGRTLFRVGYSVQSTRPALLSYYRSSLEEFEGGYPPFEVDAFLIGRLAECFGTPEWDAILRFQLDQARSGRSGDAASQSNDELKRQMIAYLVPTLDSNRPFDAMNTMVFIESLRRGYALNKGGFANGEFFDQPDPRGPSTLKRARLELAISSFRQWWGDGSNWPNSKAENPLNGTQITIHSGP